jgi:hypothetical protein
MKFDINTVLTDMLSVIKETVTNNYAKMEYVDRLFMQRDKERIEMIAVLRICGELCDEKFQSRLACEKLIIESELCALSEITKTTTQQAAYAAIDVLEKAVLIAVKVPA